MEFAWGVRRVRSVRVTTKANEQLRMDEGTGRACCCIIFNLVANLCNAPRNTYKVLQEGQRQRQAWQALLAATVQVI